MVEAFHGSEVFTVHEGDFFVESHDFDCVLDVFLFECTSLYNTVRSLAQGLINGVFL